MTLGIKWLGIKLMKPFKTKMDTHTYMFMYKLCRADKPTNILCFGNKLGK